MAAPSAPNVYIGGNHKWGSDGVAAITTTPSESVTKVTAIISQTSGGAAIETVETTVKTSSDQFADRWALSWPTTGITSSPYYVRVRSTNADGNGPFKEIAPYIYFPPTVAVTAPVNGSTLTSASVTMAWTASDPYGISAQRVTVLHGSSVLLDEAVGESDTSYAVPSSVAFLDGESYTFRVTARNGNGMEASADSTCAFSFDAPAAASVTITDDGATATITVDDPHYSESGSTISVDGSAIADSLTVFGKSTQDGTPTQSAPVAIESVEGWNLLDPGYFTQTAAGATTYTVVDGKLQVNSSDSQTWASLPTIRLEAGYYVFYRSNAAGTSTVSKIAGGSATTLVNRTSGQKAGFFQLTEASDIALKMCMSASPYPVTTEVMIAKGRTLPPYIDYGSIFVETGPKNLTPFFSHSLSDAYSGINTDGYWMAAVNASITQLSDGWAHFEYDNTGGSSAWYTDPQIAKIPTRVVESGTYTIVCEYRNLSKTGDWQTLLAYDNTQTSSALSGSAWTVSQADWNAAGTSGVFYRTGDANPSFATSNKLLRMFFQVTAGSKVSVDLRLSMYAGTYGGEYAPYVEPTYTPIPATLRSLPDGTRDELRVEGGSAVLVKRCEETLQAVTDGVTGTVGVDVLSSTGQIANGAQVVYKLAASQEIDLGSVSDMPFIPEDGEMWVDGTEMEASLRPADYAGQPPISSVDIARVNPDGTWTLAQGVTEGQSAIDPLPPLGVPYRYALTSHAAGGGMKVAYAEHTVETRAWHLNFGDAAQEHVSYLYNPQATMTLAQGGESYHFADGGAGRGLPVFYPTTDRDMSGTLKFDTVLYGDSDILLDLCDRYPVAWLRDPFGHRWRAHVRPSVSHGTWQVWPVTISWDAVRFEEA